ncbi:MAG: hypothetical protein V4654_15100 [Bdellovibrionota bacterium]
MFKYFFLTLLCGILANADAARMTARQIGPTDADLNQVTQKLLAHPDVAKILDQKDYRLITASLNERAFSSGLDYDVRIFNYTDSKMLHLRGPTDFLTAPKIELAIDDVAATPEEFEEAVNLLTQNSEFSDGLLDGDIYAYEPMPSTLATPEMLRGLGGPRIVGVGLRSKTDATIHEIVGVNLSTMAVVRFPEKAPPTSLATLAVCGLPNARQAVTGKGRSGSAEISISDTQGPLWNFVVVRPSASSGGKGSGLEIKNVYYKGKLILTRAHTPILNVQYPGGLCGPYRDWAYAENYFNAVGSDEAPGIRIATQPPTTIFDTGNDRGNFRGVAIYQTADKVTLVTEISAGWYRYASRFELYNDGRIKPVFQFSAVQNSCVCYTHHHHVYWRFDFDVGGKPNSVQVSNGATFRPVNQETMFSKNSNNQFWRITNPAGNMYDLTPGDYDGAADYYAVADAWLLRYKSNEIDDNRVRTSTRAALNSFVGSENLVNQDLVFWYSGHFLHSHDDLQHTEGEIGPTIEPR